MSQIFISYSSTDRARVAILVRALERQGLAVWWDRTIPPGRNFDDVIEEALDASSCLIVVWSKDSVRSQWVKTEASEGARRGMLVPVLIDDVTMPLEFRRIQAARLVSWNDAADEPEFQNLLRAVGTILGKTAAAGPAPAPGGTAPGIGSAPAEAPAAKRTREEETHARRRDDARAAADASPGPGRRDDPRSIQAPEPSRLAPEFEPFETKVPPRPAPEQPERDVAQRAAGSTLPEGHSRAGSANEPQAPRQVPARTERAARTEADSSGGGPRQDSRSVGRVAPAPGDAGVNRSPALSGAHAGTALPRAGGSALSGAGAAALASALVMGLATIGRGGLDAPEVRALAGTLAGLLTALLVSRSGAIRLRLDQALAISLAWGFSLGLAGLAVGGAFAGISARAAGTLSPAAIAVGSLLAAAIGGAGAGLGTALVLKQARAPLDGSGIARITFGWAGGLAAGFGVAHVLLGLAGTTRSLSASAQAFSFGCLLIAWGLGGALGMAATHAGLAPIRPLKPQGS